MMNDEADQVIKELLIHLDIDIKNILEPMKGCEFVSDYVHLLHYKCHKINPSQGGSRTNS